MGDALCRRARGPLRRPNSESGLLSHPSIPLECGFDPPTDHRCSGGLAYLGDDRGIGRLELGPDDARAAGMIGHVVMVVTLRWPRARLGGLAATTLGSAIGGRHRSARIRLGRTAGGEEPTIGFETGSAGAKCRVTATT